VISSGTKPFVANQANLDLARQLGVQIKLIQNPDRSLLHCITGVVSSILGQFVGGVWLLAQGYRVLYGGWAGWLW